MIFGSRRCDACSVHNDWVGSVENVENEQITNLITRNRTLVFARFKQEYNPD